MTDILLEIPGNKQEAKGRQHKLPTTSHRIWEYIFYSSSSEAVIRSPASQLGEFGAEGQVYPSQRPSTSGQLPLAAAQLSLQIKDVGHADERSNVMNGHADWINAFIQCWSCESYLGPRRLGEGLRKKRHWSGERKNLWITRSAPNGFWSLTQTNLCCVYFLPPSRKSWAPPEW